MLSFSKCLTSQQTEHGRTANSYTKHFFKRFTVIWWYIYNEEWFTLRFHFKMILIHMTLIHIRGCALDGLDRDTYVQWTQKWHPLLYTALLKHMQLSHIADRHLLWIVNYSSILCYELINYMNSLMIFWNKSWVFSYGLEHGQHCVTIFWSYQCYKTLTWASSRGIFLPRIE